MKLQINGQQLRLRVDEDELRRLLGGDALANHTMLPGGAAFRLLLALGPDTQASVVVDGAAAWRITLPTNAIDGYVARLPCRDGLEFVLPVGEGSLLGMTFEVDVRDSVRQRGAKSRHP